MILDLTPQANEKAVEESQCFNIGSDDMLPSSRLSPSLSSDSTTIDPATVAALSLAEINKLNSPDLVELAIIHSKEIKSQKESLDQLYARLTKLSDEWELRKNKIVTTIFSPQTEEDYYSNSHYNCSRAAESYYNECQNLLNAIRTIYPLFDLSSTEFNNLLDLEKKLSQELSNLSQIQKKTDVEVSAFLNVRHAFNSYTQIELLIAQDRVNQLFNDFSATLSDPNHTTRSPRFHRNPELLKRISQKKNILESGRIIQELAGLEKSKIEKEKDELIARIKKMNLNSIKSFLDTEQNKLFEHPAIIPHIHTRLTISAEKWIQSWSDLSGEIAQLSTPKNSRELPKRNYQILSQIVFFKNKRILKILSSSLQYFKGSDLENLNALVAKISDRQQKISQILQMSKRELFDYMNCCLNPLVLETYSHMEVIAAHARLCILRETHEKQVKTANLSIPKTIHDEDKSPFSPSPPPPLSPTKEDVEFEKDSIKKLNYLIKKFTNNQKYS